MLASAASRQLLTDGTTVIELLAEGAQDHGHVICEQMREENKVAYSRPRSSGNVDAEVRAVIKRPNFLIKNKISHDTITQCEVVIVGEVDDKVESVRDRLVMIVWRDRGQRRSTSPRTKASTPLLAQLTHVAGGSVVYAFGVDGDDIQLLYRWRPRSA